MSKPTDAQIQAEIDRRFPDLAAERKKRQAADDLEAKKVLHDLKSGKSEDEIKRNHEKRQRGRQ